MAEPAFLGSSCNGAGNAAAWGSFESNTLPPHTNRHKTTLVFLCLSGNFRGQSSIEKQKVERATDRYNAKQHHCKDGNLENSRRPRSESWESSAWIWLLASTGGGYFSWKSRIFDDVFRCLPSCIQIQTTIDTPSVKERQEPFKPS